jgi:hypothetical protein
MSDRRFSSPRMDKKWANRSAPIPHPANLLLELVELTGIEPMTS